MKPMMPLAVLLMLAACSSTPLPSTYVLSTAPEPVVGVRDDVGRPFLVVPTVSLPDYLDTTDLLIRDGTNRMQASATGRWGERLSLGITHALVADLARLLPDHLVTHNSLSDRPGRRVLVNVEAFDLAADGRCVLTAHWTVPSDASHPAIDEQGSFVTQAAATATNGTRTISDAAYVSAMVAAIEQLANRIALGVPHGGRP